MYAPLVLVGPCGIAEQARQAHLYLFQRLCQTTSRLLHNTLRKFAFTHSEIFSNVIQDLRTIMCRVRGPTASRVRRLDRVTNILAVALTNLSDHPSTRAIHDTAITRIRPHLLPLNKELGRAINSR